MSRSNPHENSAPNPAVRWFEWNGENGSVRYYDKDAKKNVEVGADFTFLLLDQLGSVRGWHDASDSGIYSNEVKDTRQEVLVVKSFKGGTLAEGVYKDIKDRVNSQGGQFVANLYIAFKEDGELAIGSLRLKGAALGSWMEFCKTHRADLFKKAIRINGYTEGKKGKVVYRMPILGLLDISAESDKAATGLDAVLQEWLKGYFKRTKKDQADHVGNSGTEHTSEPTQDPQDWPTGADIDASDVPF
jgi:hypothetical protein